MDSNARILTLSAALILSCGGGRAAQQGAPADPDASAAMVDRNGIRDGGAADVGGPNESGTVAMASSEGGPGSTVDSATGVDSPIGAPPWLSQDASGEASGEGGALAVVARVTNWISSTSASTWQTQPNPPFENYDGTATDLVEVADGSTAQVIDGFGGCFNELGWQALQVLDPTLQDEVMRNLFDPAAGCGFNIARMPIGASDYATSWYSLAETPGDYQMASFSIVRDQGNLIPFIKAAMKWSPALRVWGSAWSPPAWMKTNGVYNGGALKQDAQTLSAYALYLQKYVQAYRAQGIDVYAVHVQNEPYAAQPFPSCMWDAAQMRDFVKTYLGPTFKNAGLNAEIWLGTLNNGVYAQGAGIVLADPVASGFITGVGYQWAGKDAIGPTHAAHPEKKLMQTETECGTGTNDWTYAEYTWSLFKLYLRNFANSYMQWNMVLDETGTSTWGWRQSAMVTVNKTTRTVTYNPQFQLVKHISHFVKPSAYRVDTQGSFDDALAFLNPDQTRVIVMTNALGTARSARIKFGARMFRATLQPHSFNTFVVGP